MIQEDWFEVLFDLHDQFKCLLVLPLTYICDTWMNENWFQLPLYIGHHTWTPSQSRSSVISIFYLKNKNIDYIGINWQHFTVPHKLAASQLRGTVDASGCFHIQLTTCFVVP
jgi:hypothetical protein